MIILLMPVIIALLVVAVVRLLREVKSLTHENALLSQIVKKGRFAIDVPNKVRYNIGRGELYV
ncbi:MAG: hypothetical protein RR573_06215 [Oscillospiraceae bacterium]